MNHGTAGTLLPVLPTVPGIRTAPMNSLPLIPIKPSRPATWRRVLPYVLIPMAIVTLALLADALAR